MIESIARRERFDTQTSASPCYVWAVPQKPVSVHLSCELIDRLEREAVESFRSLTSRGSEIGGLLLGSVSPGTPAVVTIEDYEPVGCDYARGPLYRLSGGDLARLERAMEQRGTSPGPRVVGFYRSHTRKGLSLDAEDLAFFEARFRDPSNIALLIRPFATKASVGAIFIWEDGSVRGDASYLEFPFRSAQLPAGAPAHQAEVPESGPAVTTTPAPVAPKGPVRAQIVPIATRREIVMPAPVAAPVSTKSPTPELPAKDPAAEVSAAPAEAPSPEPAEAPRENTSEAPRTEAKSVPPAETLPAPEPRAVTREPELREPLFHDASPAVEPEQASPEPEFDAPARSGKLLWIIGAAAAVAVTLVLLLVYPGFLRTGGKQPEPAPAPVIARQDASPLSLRVERTADELLLTWNRDSSAIQQATTALLSISDGARHENYKMELEELRKGSIVYMPQTPDVSFRMEVMNSRGEKTGSELVRVLRTSPMPAETKTAAGGKPVPEPQAAAAEPETKNVEPARPAPKAAKPFQMEPLAGRLRPARVEDVPEAPTLHGSAGSPSPVLNLGGGSAVPAPPARVPSSPSTPMGGKIVQAQLISRREPEYPTLARQSGVKGAVTLEALIGKDGKVKNVRVISGHPLLQRAAADAVKQWIYRPTMLNGVPVDSPTQIVLNFVGPR
jgi:protein TonB